MSGGGHRWFKRSTGKKTPVTRNNNNSNNNNNKLKETFGSCTRKTSDRLITEDGYTWNSAHNTESTAV
jgi:hypothetical protein